MKKLLFFTAILSFSSYLSSQTTNNPFEKLGFKNVQIATSSKGEFEEFHDQKEVVEIGSVLFNSKTNEIVGFIEENNSIANLSASTPAMSIDPLCEKYYWISPYAFCLNNPVRFIDPFGKDVWEINENGEITNRIKDKTQDAFYMVAKDADGKYQRTFTTNADGNKEYNSLSFSYGTVESQKTITYSPDGKQVLSYDSYKVRGDENGTQMFEFMSQNTQVEWSQTMTGIEGDKGLNFLTTGHLTNTDPGGSQLFGSQLYAGYTIREMNHNHPGNTPRPSGLTDGAGDIGFSNMVTNNLQQNSLSVPVFHIYTPGTKSYIKYSPKSVRSDFK